MVDSKRNVNGTVMFNYSSKLFLNIVVPEKPENLEKEDLPPRPLNPVSQLRSQLCLRFVSIALHVKMQTTVSRRKQHVLTISTCQAHICKVYKLKKI